MEKRERDIVIAGGGMVGVSLALQLAASLPETARISLMEGFPLPAPGAGGRPEYHPSFDARSTALSYSSRQIYTRMGLWGELERWLCPIETIHVSSRGRFGSTELRAADQHWPALGYVVENTWLGNTLLGALQRAGRVELVSPARVTAARPGDGWVELETDGAGTWRTRLLVVADGAGSGLRDALGVAVREKPYRQHALIANVAFARPHRGRAFERFTASGPLALLPLLPSRPGEQRAALVWTLPGPRAEALAACGEEEFLEALQLAFGYRLGRFQRAGERQCYPLALRESREQARRGVVVMGNAAHTLHPVAGQGFNLALRDVAQLAGVLAAAPGPSHYGDPALLGRYQAARAGDQARTIGASDLLPGLFMRDAPLLGITRDLALSGLDLAGPLKREFIRHAAGAVALGEGRG